MKKIVNSLLVGILVFVFVGMSANASEFVDNDIATYSVSTQPSPVTNLKAEAAGKNKVKLSWNAVESVDGYLIYGQKNGQYGYVGMTTKGTTYTDTNALDSDYNFYWVFPYVKNAAGKMIPGSCTKYVYAKGVCSAVTNLKASLLKGGVKLSWTATNDAEGYLVYGIVNNGKYGYVGMTNNSTSYIDKNASSSVYNFYWIFPYHTGAAGQMVVGQTGKYVYGKAIATVYWVENGKSYHFSKDCTSLKRSTNIIEGTLSDAINLGKTDPCNLCAGGQ